MSCDGERYRSVVQAMIFTKTRQPAVLFQNKKSCQRSTQSCKIYIYICMVHVSTVCLGSLENMGMKTVKLATPMIGWPFNVMDMSCIQSGIYYDLVINNKYADCKCVQGVTCTSGPSCTAACCNYRAEVALEPASGCSLCSPVSERSQTNGLARSASECLFQC